ncbi:MAG: NAD(P)-binding domain-containing protein [Roseiflexaceae bacterium]
MNIGIIGSGVVGQAVGSKLAQLGHSVVIGSRDPGKLAEWVAQTGPNARAGTFAEAAAHGEIVINATSGTVSLEALELAGGENLRGKILIDLANPLDFSQGMPPRLTVSNTDSLAEQIQRAYPETHVVKTLNTVNTSVMVSPQVVGGGDHHLFISGNNPEAKAAVTELLHSFGWEHVVDLGDIRTARGTEMLLPLWLNLMGVFGTPTFNFKLVR